MSADDPHFRLKLPGELHTFITEAARANNRSINAEIIFRLQQTVNDMVEGNPEYSSRLADKFILRLPDGFRDRLAALAKRNGRSMNSELGMALAEWLRLHEASAEQPSAAPAPC